MPTEPLSRLHRLLLLLTLMVLKPKPRLQSHRQEPKIGLPQAKPRQR